MHDSVMRARAKRIFEAHSDKLRCMLMEYCENLRELESVLNELDPSD